MNSTVKNINLELTVISKEKSIELLNQSKVLIQHYDLDPESNAIVYDVPAIG